MPPIDEAVRAYYDQGREHERLMDGGATLELVRTQELLRRYLPPSPASVLDVGGGSGVYARWLAEDGYRVHVIDPVPLHVEQALAGAKEQPERPFTAALGDARRLVEADDSFDAVLLLGPLYHLTERADRIAALAEARRVVRAGGVVLAVAISRFASLLDGLRRGFLSDPEGARMVERDLREGQHRNPSNRPGWFTTAFFHHPTELAAEVEAAGFACETVLGVEGPGCLFGTQWEDFARRPSILAAARAVEQEPSLLGISSHLLAVARKPLT